MVNRETSEARVTGVLNATENDVEESVVTDIPAVSPIASKVPALFPIIASTDEVL
jgi:hypothetical protein